MRFALFAAGLAAAAPIPTALPKAASLSKVSKPAPPAPAQIAFNRFVALSDAEKLNTPQAKKMVTGEAMQFTQIRSFGPLSKPDGLLQYAPDRAVIRVQPLQDGKPMADVYFYLSKTGPDWKISAMRSLALTEMLERVQEELEAKPTQSDSEKAFLANIKLTLSRDRDLRLYLRAHLADFEKLRQLAPGKSKAASDLGKKLNLGHVDARQSPNILFEIGGMVDNTVGFIYSPNNKPPQISTDDYIWVEKVLDHWYLYKTT